MRNSLADVVAAALRVLDDQGLEGCSMRRVAAELGVQPSALYHHVSDKQTLLALMADEIVAGVGERARRMSAVMPAGVKPTQLGSAKMRPMVTYLGEPDQAQAQGRQAVARRMCEELRESMLATRDGADVVATAAAFRMGASELEDELAELVGRDGARTLLIYTFGQAQQTQMHRQAVAFGVLVGAPAAPVLQGDGLDEAFTRGLDLILTGLAA